ncbi:MAG: efflux RND transporter permease subunit [Beijerinckiaceae bacterium]
MKPRSEDSTRPLGPPRRLRRLAFGLERIGLVSLYFPRIFAVLLGLLSVLAVIGVSRIKLDDSLSQLFRSDTPEFKQYEAETQRFPSTEFDVLVVIEGKALLQRNSLEKLRDLVIDLQLVEGTRGIISLFSARQAPEAGRLPAPLFPEELPSGADYDALIQRVMANDIIRGKLLSEDGQLALIVVSLEPGVVSNNSLGQVVGEIRRVMAEDLSGAGLVAQLSGVPVMQLEIRNAVERDRIIYNALGFFGGCLIAIVFFRRVSFMIMAAAPPLLAILLALGALGWLDYRLNMFLNMMTPLIMVISFSDSMQLTFAARDRIIAGDSKADALRWTLSVVGPACVLTHATAGISFVALMFSDSELIRIFAEAGLIATIIALFAVLTFVPLLGILLLRRESAFSAKLKGADTRVDALRRFCGFIAARMVTRPGLYSFIAVFVLAALALNYVVLEPRYRLADQVPDQQQAVAASHELDTKLTGANPVDVLIEFPEGQSLYAPETLAAIATVHEILERQAGVGNVWSLETLRRWVAEKVGRSDVTTLERYVSILPTYLKRRFISEDERAVIVQGRIPDVDASRLLPVIDSLNNALNEVRLQHPGYEIAVTGLSAIAARNSARMIEKLNRGLTIEIIFVAAFIGAAFRSPRVMVATIMPAIFPVFAAGAILAALGQGLQFASIVALTVSFGLGLSATIHFLNRLFLEAESSRDTAHAVERATILVGPALILTSIVLACGLAMTVFSNLPALRLFGWLSAFAMLAALIADLFILRPVVMFLYRFGRQKNGTGIPL